MKKLSLEGLFHPGEHDNNDGHRFPRPMRTVGRDEFPYVDDAGETMSDDEIEEETGLGFGLYEFYKASSIKANDGVSLGKMIHRGGGHKGGKGKSWGNWITKASEEEPEEKAETRALPTDWFNNDEDSDLEEFDKYFGLDEVARVPRDTATKELAPVSTKQGFKNGIPSSGPNYTTQDDIDPEEEKRKIEGELGLSLESALIKVFKEWADSDWSRAAGSKKVKADKADLDFFDLMTSDHEFLMNTADEFREGQKRGKDEKKEEGKKKNRKGL